MRGQARNVVCYLALWDVPFRSFLEDSAEDLFSRFGSYWWQFIVERTFRLPFETDPVCFPIIGVAGWSRGFGGRGEPAVKVYDDRKVVGI